MTNKDAIANLNEAWKMINSVRIDVMHEEVAKGDDEVSALLVEAEENLTKAIEAITPFTKK
jgi:hypothetical protein